MKAPLLFCLAFIVAFSSCTSEEKKNVIPVDTFASEKILIDLSYPEYPDTVVVSIMSGVGLCDIILDPSKPDSLKNPLCGHDRFRVFMNHRSGNWNEGFLVEAKANVYSPDFRVLNIAKIDGVFKVTNDFAGELLELRTTPSGKYDMIIRYKDGVVGTVAIYHEWRKNHYEPTTVVELNDHFVKEDKMDSLNKVYIDNFSWGF